MKKIARFSWAALLGAALLLASQVARAERIDLPVGDAPTIGADNAQVTIIEFVDYQ